MKVINCHGNTESVRISLAPPGPSSAVIGRSRNPGIRSPSASALISVDICRTLLSVSSTSLHGGIVMQPIAEQSHFIKQFARRKGTLQLQFFFLAIKELQFYSVIESNPC